MHDPGFVCLATGDPYKNPMVPGIRKFEKDGFLKGGHDLPFKPAKTCTHVRANTVAAFEYIDKAPLPRRNCRNEDKEVIIEPVGFLTKPMLKGKTATSLVIHPDGHYKYEGDDYNAQKKLMNKELKAHHDTMYGMLGDDFKPFSQVGG